MTRNGCSGLLVVGLTVLVMQGCATVQEGHGSAFLLSSGVFPSRETTQPLVHPGSAPPSGDWTMQAEERRAEVEWALTRMWEVANGDEQVGAEWVLTFWSQGGALTLLSWGRTASGEKTGHPVDRDAFMNALRGLLTLLTESRTGALVFTLHRQQHHWQVSYEAVSMKEPPEARPRPTQRTGSAAETLSATQAVAREVTRLLLVPAGASAHLEMEVALEDDRIIGWEPGPYHANAGGSMRPAASQAFDAFSPA